MTSPHVTELPRKLEPTGRDTFAAGVVIEFAPAAERAGNARPMRRPQAAPPDGRPPPDAAAQRGVATAPGARRPARWRSARASTGAVLPERHR